MKFEFNINTFITFFVGIIFGAIFLVLIYLLIALNSIRSKKKNIEKINTSITEDDINKIIKDKQKEFLIYRKSNPIYYSLKTVVIDLVNEIAKIYYPKSKHPIGELSIDELIILDRYIVSKLEELLSKRGLSILKNIRISTLLNIADANYKFQNNKAVKYSKKLHAPKIVKTIQMGLNIINPFYWFKKLVVSPSMNLLIKKIFLLIITIIGEETYAVYSKKLFITEDEEIKLLNEIEEEENKNEVTIK